MVKKPVTTTKEDSKPARFVETAVRNLSEADWKEWKWKIEKTTIVDRILLRGSGLVYRAYRFSRRAC